MAVREFVILGSAKAASRRAHLRYPITIASAFAIWLSQEASAQQPTPLFNTPPNQSPAGAAPSQAPSIPTEALPPPASAGPLPPSAAPAPAEPSPPPPNAPAAAAPARDFCDQSVTARPANPSTVPERFRPFVGIFSDADWNPTTCAALIVENVAEDGTATITYVFGPLTTGGKPAGGTLHGTGIVKDGALLFQNNDGSQYAFQPFYSDLAGKWTTPKGQTYQAIFKRSY